VQQLCAAAAAGDAAGAEAALAAAPGLLEERVFDVDTGGCCALFVCCTFFCILVNLKILCLSAP
jgi:hypothetical protein